MAVFIGSMRDELIERYGAIKQSDGTYVDEFGGVNWFNERGEWHRVDGPAVLHKEQGATWFFDGVNFPFNEWCNIVGISEEYKMMLRLQYG